jgi:hypothetical protein
MDAEKQNGAALDPQKFSTVTLTLDRERCELKIGGAVANYNEAINILQMASREFEAKLAAERAGASVALASGRGIRFPFVGKH